ncbi:MAG: hypothetical protein ACPG46_11360 [Thalassotalea sp.]
MKFSQLKWSVLIALMVFFSVFSGVTDSKPKTTIFFEKTAAGFIKAKIRNETAEQLACYIAIDGHKKKFRLSGQMESKWYAATDKRFTHKNFSTWCDYLEFYPQYQHYSLG